MSHTLTENTILSVMTYDLAWRLLEEIFQASEGEYTINYGEGIPAACDDALSYLYDHGFIAAKPVMPRAPYNFVPTDLAREFFELNYQGQCREPRNAHQARLQGQWDERPGLTPTQLTLAFYPEL